MASTNSIELGALAPDARRSRTQVAQDIREVLAVINFQKQESPGASDPVGVFEMDDEEILALAQANLKDSDLWQNRLPETLTPAANGSVPSTTPEINQIKTSAELKQFLEELVQEYGSGQE